MTIFSRTLAVALGLLVVGAVPAMASTLDFDFSFNGGATGTGVFTASSTSTAGQYEITGISGVVDGSAIDALMAPDTYSPFYIPANDNLLFDPKVDKAYLDDSGVSFETAAGEYFNLYFESGTYMVLSSFSISDEPNSDSLRSFKVTEEAVATTPEPGSLLLVGSGALGAIGVLRRRFV